MSHGQGLQNPFLRGMLANQASQERSAANQIGLLGSVTNLQNQMEMAPINRELSQLQLDKARMGPGPKWQVQEQFDSQGRKIKVMVDMNNPSNIQPFGNAQLPNQQMVNVPVPGRPGVTQPTWMRPGETQGAAVGGQSMPEILNPEVFDARAKLARAGKTTVNTTVLPPQKTFENENKLRDDYTTASKPFVGIRDAYNTISGALSGPITAVSTLAGATKFMKMIDPESVVRESELNMALKATGMLDRFMNLHNTVMKGQVLTPNQAKEIQQMATVLYETAKKQQGKTDEYFGGLADSYGLQRNRVIRDQSSAVAPNPRRRSGDVMEDADRIIGGQ